MTSEMTPAETERSLLALGVPADKARAAATGVSVVPAQVATVRTPIAWPVHITIPWSALVSDNDKDRPMIRSGKPIKVLTERYAKAKEQIGNLARLAVCGATPAACDLEFRAMVYMPTARKADATNFAKLVQDAMEKIVYEGDRWLARVTWERAVDVDAPRAEIIITPLI